MRSRRLLLALCALALMLGAPAAATPAAAALVFPRHLGPITRHLPHGPRLPSTGGEPLITALLGATMLLTGGVLRVRTRS